MAKVKFFNLETGVYKLKVDSAQMQLIAKLLSHVVQDRRTVFGQAASELTSAIENSACAEMLDSSDLNIVAFRPDSVTGEKVITIPDEHLCLELQDEYFNFEPIEE